MKLWIYVARRLALTIPVLLGVTLITFYLSYGSEIRILNTIARGDSLAEFLNTGENIRQTLYVNYSNFEGADIIHDLNLPIKDIAKQEIPEIGNIFCLGKVTDVVLDGNSVYIVSGTNQKVFIYLSSAIFLFFILLLQFLRNDKKLILSLFTLALVFVQLYLFSSFKNPLISFINLIVLVFIAFATLESFKNP